MTLEKLKYEKLFSSPIMRFKVADSSVLNAEIMFEGERLRGASDGVKKSNRGGWHSEGNLFEDEAPSIQRLRGLAEDAVWNIMKQTASKADADKLSLKFFSWMNANPVGGYNAPHTHPGAHWSGVYYVAQPEIDEGSSGMIEFLDPRADLPNWRLLDIKSFRPKHRFRPMPGELIIFPSYLVHWVYPNESDDERVTIAFNATFKKKAKS